MTAERVSAIRRACVRFVRNLVLLCVAVAALVLAYAHVVEIPPPIAKWVLKQVNRGGLTFTMEHARLEQLLFVRMREVDLYRKGVLGAPMWEAATARIQLNPLAWLRGHSLMSALWADDAVWRPSQGSRREESVERHEPQPYTRHLRFRMDVTNCRLYDVLLKRIVAQVDGVGCKIDVSDLEVALQRQRQSGRLHGALSYDRPTRIMSGQVVTQLDPNLLTPILATHRMTACQALVDRFEFGGKPPHGEWQFDRRMGHQNDFHLTGDFRMRNCAYRGVDLLRADGSVTVDHRPEESIVNVNNLFLVRREGMANVAFSVWPRKQRIEFEAESSLDPLAMGRMMGTMTNLLARQVVFTGTSTIACGGVVDMVGDHADTDVEGSIQANAVRINRYNCEKASVSVRMRGPEVTFTNMAATVYGGDVRGSMVIAVPWEGEKHPAAERKVPFRLDLNARDCNFEQFMSDTLTHDLPMQGYQGRLAGALQLAGQFGGENATQQLHGSGWIKVRDGRVFMLPIFGQLSSYLTQIIPGLDFVLRQNDATADFEIIEGRIKTDKVTIEGDILSLDGHGLYAIGDALDFNVQVKLMKEHTLVAKLLRVITYPISKLFEFQLEGQLDAPRWYPVNFSSDLLERMGLRKVKQAPAVETKTLLKDEEK